MGRCQIHGALEGQVLVVEHVMTENLATLGLFHLIIVLQRVGHHEVHGLVHLHEVRVLFVVGVLLYLVGLLRVLRAELRCLALVLDLLFLTDVTVLFTHTGLHVLRPCCDVVGTQRTVLRLSLVFLLDTANLLDGDTAPHQLCDDFLSRHTLGVLLHDIVHHLVVGHSRLSPCHGGR